MVDQPVGSVSATFETKAEALKDPASEVRFWLDAIDVATEQDQDWRTEADLATKIYRADKSQPRSFNILHSNVSVKVPAIYNSTPEPDVRPRDRSNQDQEGSEAARLGAQLIDLALRYQLDEYDFDAFARSVAKDAQIAGRGIGRVAWKTYWTEDQETGDKVAWETVACKRVPWRYFRHGPANSFEELPWVAYQHALTRDQIVQLAGPEIGKEVPLDETVVVNAKDDKRSLSVWQRAIVWEIWDKDTREVIFIAPGYTKGVLHREPDPYGLLEFFDCEVVQPITDPDSLTPVCPYLIYKEQAEELSAISTRILALVKQLKWRGIRAAEIPEFDSLEDAEDGEFLVSSGALALVGGSKGLSDAIWTMPIDLLASTLKELLLQREAIKQVIYEITGISDIMRGASDPNETLGAQQIKAQSGSLRANDEQKDMEKFCRNLFRKKAEIIANKFSFDTLSMIVGEELQPSVQDVLRSDVRRRYLIDVETNSTIRGDLAKNQQNMAGFMQSAGQFIQTFVPLIQSGQFPPQLAMAAVTVFGSFAKQFKLGKVVDDTLAQLEDAAKQWMQQQQQPDPEKEALKKEAEELKKRAAYAEVAKTEGDAKVKEATAAKTAAETEVLVHQARMKTATDLINVRKTAQETKKAAEEVEAQKVETAQQEAALQGQHIDNEHKAERGPWAPDPTEIAKAKINQETAVQTGQQRADAQVKTGQQRADASVQSAREKAAKPPVPGDGFVP